MKLRTFCRGAESSDVFGMFRCKGNKHFPIGVPRAPPLWSLLMPSLVTTSHHKPKLDMGAPRCAQCQTAMVLERVEPHPRDPSKDRHSFVCRTCGLPDQIDCARTKA